MPIFSTFLMLRKSPKKSGASPRITQILSQSVLPSAQSVDCRQWPPVSRKGRLPFQCSVVLVPWLADYVVVARSITRSALLLPHRQRNRCFIKTQASVKGNYYDPVVNLCSFIAIFISGDKRKNSLPLPPGPGSSESSSLASVIHSISRQQTQVKDGK